MTIPSRNIPCNEETPRGIATGNKTENMSTCISSNCLHELESCFSKVFMYLTTLSSCTLPTQIGKVQINSFSRVSRKRYICMTISGFVKLYMFSRELDAFPTRSWPKFLERIKGDQGKLLIWNLCQCNYLHTCQNMNGIC